MTAALVGYMPMPAGFPYADIFQRGRPKHGTPGEFSTYDAFYIRHPPMKTSRRAKIFAPFAALKGFRLTHIDSSRPSHFSSLAR